MTMNYMDPSKGFAKIQLGEMLATIQCSKELIRLWQRVLIHIKMGFIVTL